MEKKNTQGTRSAATSYGGKVHRQVETFGAWNYPDQTETALGEGFWDTTISVWDTLCGTRNNTGTGWRVVNAPVDCRACIKKMTP